MALLEVRCQGYERGSVRGNGIAIVFNASFFRVVAKEANLKCSQLADGSNYISMWNHSRDK